MNGKSETSAGVNINQTANSYSDDNFKINDFLVILQNISDFDRFSLVSPDILILLLYSFGESNLFSKLKIFHLKYYISIREI